MCSHCSGSEYRETIEADARARQRAESAGRYDGHRAVAPHLKRTMELRQELQQVPRDARAIHAVESCEHTEFRWDASWGAFICLNPDCRKVMLFGDLPVQS